ncbi:hypothetical protein DPMN_054239 [Dreissena polymorpha]|uniref:Uncharacterized protein n=1 Tax=Dreissena polymorpha TaxID=45954 RepID=A0A9D4CQ64_DREPO|nr:hypothetical protein DPMN_054239 [Dreissena polymorpha]
MEEVLTFLMPLFDMDPFLPRSIVAALVPIELHSLCQLEVFPIDVCLATLRFWSLRTNPQLPSRHQCTVTVMQYEKVGF